MLANAGTFQKSLESKELPKCPHKKYVRVDVVHGADLREMWSVYPRDDKKCRSVGRNDWRCILDLRQRNNEGAMPTALRGHGSTYPQSITYPRKAVGHGTQIE